MGVAGDRSPAETGSGPRPASGSGGEREAGARLRRAIRRASLNLWWEAIWPRLAPIAALAGIFVAASWLGLWRLTGAPVRYALLALFAAAAVYLLVRLIRIRAPDRAAATRRVETASGVSHRPATAFSDKLATAADGVSHTLWQAHRRRLLTRLAGLKAGLPSPQLAVRDPYALRFAVVLALVVGFVAAGPERLDRLSEAFRGGAPPALLVARIDAWVTPPAYTDRPPLFLTGDLDRAGTPNRTVPAGSMVTVRTGDGGEISVVSLGGPQGVVTVAPQANKVAAADGLAPPLEHLIELTGDQTIAVRRGGRDLLVWRFTVEPDAPPSIAFLGWPDTSSGSLELAYSLADDYGVVAAYADIAPAHDGGQTPPRPLYQPPAIPLTLPHSRTREGSAETIRDLTAHPWAGAEVALTLVVRDEAGQEGRSDTLTISLPARRFGDPLARAVAEQRSDLALDAGARHGVSEALDAVTLGDDIDPAGDHLALRSAYHRLHLARGDDGLRDLADYLWAIALGIEEGNLSPLLRDLRAAQEALRRALEEGADQDEIARLTDQLRQAMQEYLQALAEQARRNPQISDLPDDPMRTLRSLDLERMLDRIEDLARSGARDAARQLLSELQNMLENLRAGRPLFGDPQQAGEMLEGLEELGDLIRRQEQLLNRTFRAERGQDLEGQQGRLLSREELEEALRWLQGDQQGLADALQELLDSLEGAGIGPGELGQAGRAMGQAAGELGDGRPGAALGSQGRALEALRQGTQRLLEQLAGNQPGQRRDGLGGGILGINPLPNADPLGRPRPLTGPDLGTTVKVPDEIDIQRAREILDAIRRRLGEIGRPKFERDYLERLLDRF